MRYGKKISAMLALAMLISSSSAFATVADVTVDEALLSDEIITAEAEQNTEALEEVVAVEESDESATVAEAVTVTVKQAENGKIEIANNNSAAEFTCDIPSGVTANDIVSDNDYFVLTAPAEVVCKTDKSGTFKSNPAISINYVEFRLSGPEKIFVYDAVKSGKITLYARYSDKKSVECAESSGELDLQSKYLPEDSIIPGESGDNVYGYVTFDVEAGRKYNLYSRGGAGRLFGIKFTGRSEGATTESLSANVGDEIQIVATPDPGYIVSDILVDGVSVSQNNQCIHKVTGNSEVTAIFIKDPATETGKKAFEEFTLVSETAEDLTLPEKLADGIVKITWESSNTEAMTNEGKITQKVGVDVPVTLTATALINGVETVTKTFNVIVKQYDVAAEFNKFEIEVPETISEDFKLPTKFLGLNIVWTVDQTRYLTFGTEENEEGNITATVTKPYFVEGDKAVVITATVEGTDAVKTFNATVLKNENTEEASTAKFIAERIEIEGKTNDRIEVTDDIELPTSDEIYGGTITWKSSNPNVVSATGVINRQSSTKTVYLTAIIECDGLKATKEFTIVVKGKGGTSGGGGGGGGSYSSGYSPSSGAGGVVGTYTDYEDIVNDANINTNLEAPKFNDLGDYAWAVPHINRLVNNDIVKGVGNGKFDPSGLVTREQFATMIVRAFNFKDGSTANVKKFTDVVPNSYYAEAVSILSNMGVVKGQSETIFGVGESITRQDMAVMCALATKLDAENDVTEFNDAANISDYAVDAVNKMQKCGVLAGDENNNFNPLANATRAEAAKVISVILDIMNK